MKDIKKRLKNPFTGDEGKMIDKNTAKKWRNNYEFYENTCGPGKTTIKAHFFGKNVIQPLLDLDESVGIRIYYGLTEKGEKELLIYAVDKLWNDIELEKPINPLDYSIKCPPYCSSGG